MASALFPVRAVSRTHRPKRRTAGKWFVPERPLSIEDAQAQFHALRAAAPHDVAALVPALTKSRPHLLSAADQLLVPLFTSSADPVVLRWLYVDDALITDRLRSAASSVPPTLAPEWTFSLDYRNCLVGTIDRRTGEYLDFARVSPWVRGAHSASGRAAL